MHSGPITLLEPLVVLIGRHKDMLVKISQTRMGEGELLGARQGRRIGLVWSAGVVFGAMVYLNREAKVNLNFPSTPRQRDENRRHIYIT